MNIRHSKTTSQFCLVYPISKGTFINFVGFTMSEELVRTCYQADTSGRRGFEGPWVRELSKEELCKPFERFEKDTKPLLRVSKVRIISRAFPFDSTRL